MDELAETLFRQATSMFLVPRRDWIVAVAVTILNSSVTAMLNKFSLIFPR